MDEFQQGHHPDPLEEKQKKTPPIRISLNDDIAIVHLYDSEESAHRSAQARLRHLKDPILWP